MWLENITEALTKSKTERLVLMVYYEGDNDESRAMSKELETDESIKEEISKVVALKLNENSPNAKLFHQIYPIKPSPTIYLISHQGSLLDVCSNKLDKEAFIKKLTECIENKNATPNPVPAVPQIHTSPSSAPAVNEPLNVAQASATTSSNNDETKEKSREEKKKEQMQKIEELRAGLKEKREKKEEEQSKNQEMERIKSGKELQKLRKEREEKEVLDAIKEREKDAAFDKLERERVLRALKEDQEEKRQRFEQEKLKREKEYADFKQAQLEKESAIKNRAIKLDENEVKIQFKLPDATVLVSKFKLDDPLQLAVDFVKENCQLKVFQLAISYPKRNLKEEDYGSKFEDLGLKTSAVIMVMGQMPSSSRLSVGSVESYSIINKALNIASAIFAISYALIVGLISSIFGGGVNDNQANNQPSNDNQGRRPDRRDDNSPNTYNGNGTEQK